MVRSLALPTFSRPFRFIASSSANDSSALPFLAHTELLLFPTGVLAILWFASLFGFNMPRHLAPVLWAGANLRKGI